MWNGTGALFADRNHLVAMLTGRRITVGATPVRPTAYPPVRLINVTPPMIRQLMALPT